MHVAIDLGEINTHLACWDQGKLPADASIMLKIPGLGRCDEGLTNPPWSKEILLAYFTKLYREYLLPSRLVLDSIALSVPNVFSLINRRTLLDVIEETLGLPEAVILPNPIAVTAGYQLRNPQRPLAGDILMVESLDSSFRFSILSQTEASGITLEKQFAGQITDLLREAEQAGFYSDSVWTFDCLLLGGDYRDNPAFGAFINFLPPSIIIISEPDMSLAAIAGLYVYHANNPEETGVLYNIIYPFAFYLEKYDRNLNLSCLERLPFDTDNLELECGGRYRLINLDRFSPYNLSNDNMYIHFRIYESTITDIYGEPVLPSSANLVLETYRES